ncbi:MAG: hypothetical protein R2684_10770 [Pyrinomonadaceae bacterium]
MFREKTGIPSNDTKLLLEAGFLLREMSRFKEAAAVFDGCIGLLPNSEVPMVGLATTYLQASKHERALEISLMAVESFPESSYARLHYGEALLFCGKPKEARDQLLRVISMDPGSPFSDTAEKIIQTAGLA